MIGINSANIASALIGQSRAAFAPAASGRPGAPAGAPAVIVDVSGNAKPEPEGYELFKIKQAKSLTDKQIEVAMDLVETGASFEEALAKVDVAGIVSGAHKLNGLLKAESALADEVEKANQEDAKKETAALERGEKEAAKDILDDAVDAADEAEETKKADDTVDLDKIAEEADADAEEARAEAAAADA
ncbi:hypothetical protein [Hyphococcus luteus]|uniref:Uncharacterized protein n=1 Tax=Hyphococcus luteus TaxID=2058213 RepID=A0A2S7K6F5_9PROT|nr:hypothetical protein [Marinicaulis flavus]PQA88072.1 hypothetical protein CW354_07025 [Marinicaulis flavus]